MAIRFEVLSTDGPARRGRLHTPHGAVDTPDLHARRHPGHRQGADARPARSGRRPHDPRQHLSPRPASRRRPHRRTGRPASLHALGRPHPHRQRRLPGLQPRPDAQDHRPRRRLPLAHRRRPARTDARTGRRHPGKPRRRHRHVPRRMPAVRGVAGRDCARPCAAPCTGPSAAGPPTAGPIRRCSPSSRAGPDLDLRGRCAAALAAMDFPGYALGGFSVGETPEQMVAVLGPAAALLPADKPRYLMGVGRPQDILAAVAARHRYVRLRAADAQRPQRLRLHRRRAVAAAQRLSQARSGAAGVRLSVLHLPPLQPGVPASPVPGEGDARADAAVAAQRRLLLPADASGARGDRGRAAWPSSRRSALPVGAETF